MKKKFLYYLYFIKIKYFCGTINNSERIFNQLYWKISVPFLKKRRGRNQKKILYLEEIYEAWNSRHYDRENINHHEVIYD